VEVAAGQDVSLVGEDERVVADRVRFDFEDASRVA
jgi:hypothetical protein